MDNIERKELTPFNFNDDRQNDNLDLDESIEQDELIRVEEVPHRGEEPTGEEDEGQPEGDEGVEGEEGEGQEPEHDVKIKANLAKYAAETLKAKGALPEDFEISDDITEEELDEAYVQYKTESLTNQIREEEKQRLAEEEGLTPQMIEEIKLKYYGVQDQDLNEIYVLSQLSQFQFDEHDPQFETYAQTFLKSYYKLKQISDTRIERMVESDMNDPELMALIQEAQTDLGNMKVSKETVVRQRAKDAETARLNQRQEYQKKMNDTLESGVIGGVKYSPDEISLLKKALFEKTEIVTASDGKRYRTTLYNKKRMEAATSVEKDLEQKIALILGNTNLLKNNERAKTTKKLMNKLNDYVEVNINKKTTQNKVKTVEANERGIISKPLGV